MAILLVPGISTVLILDHRADVAAQERKAAADRKAADERRAAAAERLEAEQRKAEVLARAKEQFSTCDSELRPFMDALLDVDARLDVGLSQQELSTLVGDASVAYSRIDIDELGTGRCLRIGSHLETAFNEYAATVSSWNDCIFELYCDVDRDVLPLMQERWAKASKQLNRADAVLDGLDPDSPNYRAGDGQTTA